MQTPESGATAAATLGSIRRLLLGILLVGMVGTTIELLLLEHDEGAAQLVPLILLGVGYLTIAFHAIDRGAVSVRALQILMTLFVASGLIGLVFHYQANVEFQLESDPALRGRALVWKALKAKAPPALAPAVMAELGLLGLAYAHRHPALVWHTRPLKEKTDDEST